jgi:hypothetical protein
MREVIPLMEIRKDINRALHLTEVTPVVKFTVFKDKNRALELATAPKMRPRTKHIAITKYHHFQSKVDSREVKILLVDTK